MSLRKGLVRAGRTLDSPRQKSLGGAIPTLTLDNPAGWISGEESVAMSRDKAMKVSTVNRCVEVLSTSTIKTRDGLEIARAFVPDIRTAMREDPEVQND